MSGFAIDESKVSEAEEYRAAGPRAMRYDELLVWTMLHIEESSPKSTPLMHEQDPWI